MLLNELSLIIWILIVAGVTSGLLVEVVDATLTPWGLYPIGKAPPLAIV